MRNNGTERTNFTAKLTTGNFMAKQTDFLSNNLARRAQINQDKYRGWRQ
jgi:hypothetical protein